MDLCEDESKEVLLYRLLDFVELNEAPVRVPRREEDGEVDEEPLVTEAEPVSGGFHGP